MHILIIGAAGMLGRKLVERISQLDKIGGNKPTSMTLVDVVDFELDNLNGSMAKMVGDLSDWEFSNQLANLKPDLIFNLAAVVSGEAELDFEKGYRINLDGLRNLLEAIRSVEYCPRLIFTSSIAVFGAPFPDSINDEYVVAPLTSYGIQKACCELLITDYSRKGIVDGIAIRLPTVVIRPGKPNKAASGFYSNILREPLNGRTAILPVPRDIRHWLASPKAAIGFLVHAAELDKDFLGPRRAITMPGISVDVGEMIDALGNIAGLDRVKLIKEKYDAEIIGIVKNWPRKFETKRALELGFKSDRSIDDIIQLYIDEELGGKLRPIQLN